MADFFKGLAGGFGTGLQFGQAMQARQERERLREAMGLTPQEMQQRQATPDELGRAQAETQGLAAQDAAMFGLTPQQQAQYAPQMPIEGQRIGATQYGLGGQTFNRMPTQQEIEAARFAAAANVIAERDPVAAMRMRQEQVRMQREAEEAPLRRQALETQVEAGKLGLDRTRQDLTAGERTAAAAKRMDDFNAWRSQNPQAGFAEINAEVQRLGMGVDEQFKVASSLTGIKEQAFKDSQMRIRDLVKNQGLDGLLKAHKESNDLDPGSHFEVIRGKGGTVSLNRVDTATGRVIRPNVFSGSEAETTAYLNRAAMDPATIIDFTMNLAKNKSAIEAQGAATEASRATTGLRTKQGQMLDTQAAGNAEAQQIRARYDALTPEEQVGPAGQGLIRQFNMANAKAGAAVPLGAAPRAAKPEFTPEKYASTVRGFTAAGFSQTDALIRADQLYGRAPPDSNLDAGLQKQNAAKGTGTRTAPVEVQPGERYMVAPGAAVRAPLDQFLRESRRGLFGGVEYFYTDPVTGRRYTTEQYNQLQTQ